MDVFVSFRDGPLDRSGVLLDERDLADGRRFDFRPAVLEEDADPDEVHRYRLCPVHGRWVYQLIVDTTDATSPAGAGEPSHP